MSTHIISVYLLSKNIPSHQSPRSYSTNQAKTPLLAQVGTKHGVRERRREKGILSMTRRRDIKDVRENRRYGALCSRERLGIHRLLQRIMSFAELDESDRLGEGVPRREPNHAMMIAAIVSNICPRRAERERRLGLGACSGAVCRLLCLCGRCCAKMGDGVP